MVLIPHFRNSSVFLNPYLASDIMDSIRPKLEQLEHDNYQIKKTSAFIPGVHASSDYNDASAYAVVDFNSGEVLAHKNLSKKLPIASLTKVMTAVVALDLADPHDFFEVSEKAASQVPTKVMLKAGEKYSLGELLSSLLLSSANDSAQVIKEGIDKKYGEEVFIRSMNEKARILGLKNSQFANPQGFDEAGNFSTAEDLSILSHYSLTRYPLISRIVSSLIDDQTKGGADMRFYLQNWNGLLGVYPGANGIKIGNTKDAKYTTIVTSKRERETILVVLLGTPGVKERDLWAAKLLDLGFEKKGLRPVNLTEDQLQAKYSSWKYFN